MKESALLDRFDKVRERLALAIRRSGRQDQDVRLMAVSKGHSPAAVLCLARYWRKTGGLPLFGENYLQEALAKQEATELEHQHWHFIGHAQKNKARLLAGRFSLIHSLDSLTLAQNLQKLAEKLPAAPQAVLIQINLGREASKSGIAPEEAENMIRCLRELPGLEPQGLMCLPPYAEDPEASRPYFTALRQKRDALERDLGLKLRHLSMGMSHDFEIAVEEGATLVRVGTDIFGPREQR